MIDFDAEIAAAQERKSDIDSEIRAMQERYIYSRYIEPFETAAQRAHDLHMHYRRVYLPGYVE